MSEAFTKDLIGIEDGNKMLDAMIAQDAAAAATAGKEQEQEQGEQGAQSAESEAAKGTDKTDGTDGTDEAKAAQARDEAGKFAKAEADKAAEAAKGNEQGKDEGKGSRYEKAKARLTGSWDELNATKATLQAEREAWTKQQQAERQALEQERAEFEAERAKAEGQFSPEEYDKAAAKFERDGKFDLADAAKAKAAELRKNPPAKPADRLAGQRKEWAMKAGQEFPDIMKDNSPLQVRVAQLMKAEPDLERHPKGIYLAARIASLEAKASGADALTAKVAAADKALATANARIKELEQLTAPGDGQANNRLPKAKSFEQMSDTEQFLELERQAQEMGSLVR